MSDFLTKLLQPIEGPSPAGNYLRNEPDDDGLTVYDKIKKARAKKMILVEKKIEAKIQDILRDKGW